MITANEYSSYKQQQEKIAETSAAKLLEEIGPSPASSHPCAAPSHREAGTTQPRAPSRTGWKRGTVSSNKRKSPPVKQNDPTAKGIFHPRNRRLQ